MRQEQAKRPQPVAILAIATLLACASTAALGQSTASSSEALRHLDKRDCEPAVDALNAGMGASEPRSYFVAGQLFQHGYCLTKSVERATALYELGVKLGDRDCARALALMHARGDGVPQSYQQAARWYAAGRQDKGSAKEPTVAAFVTPDVVVKAYVEAVNDVAIETLAYPREAIDKGVTSVVKFRFDPRIAKVTLLASTDSNADPNAASPDRHDFEKALLDAYADAIRVLPRPAMPPNIDFSIEREARFERRVYVASEPAALLALPR